MNGLTMDLKNNIKYTVSRYNGGPPMTAVRPGLTAAWGELDQARTDPVCWTPADLLLSHTLRQYLGLS